ncbi:hypothetical protein ACMA1I_21035 [Pontibacter sp. 13R65]|uniref:hypothetical protein n=1 Tax=Pontibacter sp. 13R65 TaxID=3127458 RepID=UPI00301BE7F7
MGKIQLLSRHYGVHSLYLEKAYLLFFKVLQQIRQLAITRNTTTDKFFATALTCTKEPTALSQEAVIQIEHTVLWECMAQPAQFYDLLKLLPLEAKNKSLSFDLGEDLARKGLAETCFRAGRICIKITPQGINYLKAQESRETINPSCL